MSYGFDRTGESTPYASDVNKSNKEERKAGSGLNNGLEILKKHLLYAWAAAYDLEKMSEKGSTENKFFDDLNMRINRLQHDLNMFLGSRDNEK